MLNSSSNLYGSEWLALVFSNRNKNYGAYVLRSQSSNILLRSLLIVAPLFVMLFVGPLLYAQWHKEDARPIERVVPVDLSDVVHDIKKPDEVKKPDPVKELPKASPVNAKSVNLTANIQVVDEPIVEPPTTIQVQQAVVASTTQEGASGIQNANTSTSPGGDGTGNGEGQVDGNAVYEAGGIENYPEFPGGMEAFSKFIQKNLRYPSPAQEAEVQGKVFLSFVVEKDGSITDVQVTKGIGYGCDDEAMRVIKKSPRWKPGSQNNRFVRVRYRMPINYVMSN
jgi:protein TonB